MKAFDAYIEFFKNNTLADSSWSSYRPNVKEYVDLMGDIEIADTFDRESLRKYILAEGKDCVNKYAALWSFYEFTNEHILNIPKHLRIPFPVDRQEAVQVREQRLNRTDNNSTVFIDKNIVIEQLFDDAFYYHLEDKTAIITARAVIALAISAAYDTGEIELKMKTNDIHIDSAYVVVKNFYNTPVPLITVHGKCAKYIKEYYDIRMSFIPEDSKDENLFFVKMWEGRNLNWDKDFIKNKAATVKGLVYYVLKNISKKLNIDPPLSIKDLKYNCVLHSLYKSKGVTLQNIIEMYGYPDFVEDSVEKYFEDIGNTTYFGFDPFFINASSDRIEQGSVNMSGEALSTTSCQGIIDDIIAARVRQSIITERIRDKKKVRNLKEKYGNICQICGTPLTLVNMVPYSEVCHIQPLGEDHNGEDDYSNMLVLCPNHHVLLDLGVISIDPEDKKTILHIDKNNPLHLRRLVITKHELSAVALKYHYDKIHLNLYSKLYKSMNKNKLDRSTELLC